MYNNRQIYHTNNRNGFIPLIIGGIIGYSIGNNNRPTYYPYPIYGQIFPYQVPIFYPQPFRKRYY